MTTHDTLLVFGVGVLVGLLVTLTVDVWLHYHGEASGRDDE